MSIRQRVAPLAVVLLAAGAGACSEAAFEPTDSPSAEPAQPSFALAAGLGCDRSSPIDAFGLTHLPMGAAQLDLTSNGGLRVSGLGPSGADGVCTRLPRVTRLHVSLAGHRQGGLGPLGPDETFRITLLGPNGWRQVCAVAGDYPTGVGSIAAGQASLVCRNPDVLGWVVRLIKDGKVVRSATVDGPRLALNVPALVLTDFEWDRTTSGALSIEEVREGVVLKGLMLIPITNFASPLPAGLTGMATTLATNRSNRAYGYLDYVYPSAIRGRTIPGRRRPTSAPERQAMPPAVAFAP
ncbi:MAG: hypothetical protein R2909_21315 [Gemmatimonadales bacterium]